MEKVKAKWNMRKRERMKHFFYTSYLNKEYVNLIIESHFCSVTYVLPFRFIWSSSFQIRIRTVLTARKEEILSWENGKTTNDIIVRFLFVELRCADWEKKTGKSVKHDREIITARWRCSPHPSIEQIFSREREREGREIERKKG